MVALFGILYFGFGEELSSSTGQKLHVGLGRAICKLFDYTSHQAMKDNRDALDFGTMDVPRLFVKLFVPTLMGLIFSAILNLADGIFVGKGVGSDALASVNVAAPIFLVSTGIALLFASGVSIVAAVHLSQGKKKTASINVTQAFTVSAFVLLLFSLAIFFFPSQLCHLFGGTEKLSPYVLTYPRGVSPVPVLTALINPKRKKPGLTFPLSRKGESWLFVFSSSKGRHLTGPSASPLSRCRPR